MTSHPYTGLLGGIADLLLALEEEHHLDGWDSRPPTLYRVSLDANDWWLVDACPLGVHTDHHPRDELWALAHAADNPLRIAFLESIFDGPPCAHLLIAETWMRAYDSDAEREKETRRFADIPGSIETRTAAAMVGKHLITLSRRRGEAPVFYDLLDANSFPEEAGMLVSLRDLHQRTAAHWRQPAAQKQ